jgi:hypothetical protein
VDDAFVDHPPHSLSLHAILERLIEADVDELSEGGASSRDVYHLGGKLVDLLDYR